MKRRAVVENRRDRKALVADAGYGKVSLVSVLAGVLVAYGAFALLAGPATALLEALDLNGDIGAAWDEIGIAAGLITAAILFGAYLFGGYVAGRMARRAGITHGLAVFALGIVVLIVAAASVTALGGSDAILERLRDLGLPTTADGWAAVVTVAGLASLAAMLLGSLLGGSLGERWHAKLLARAVDPEVGTEATARRRAEDAATLAGERHTESVQRVDAANPSRNVADTPGAYTDGTRPAGVVTADRGYPEGGPVDPDDRTLTGRPATAGEAPTGETPWRQLTRRRNGNNRNTDADIDTRS